MRSAGRIPSRNLRSGSELHELDLGQHASVRIRAFRYQIYIIIVLLWIIVL